MKDPVPFKVVKRQDAQAALQTLLEKKMRSPCVWLTQEWHHTMHLACWSWVSTRSRKMERTCCPDTLICADAAVLFTQRTAVMLSLTRLKACLRHEAALLGVVTASVREPTKVLFERMNSALQGTVKFND